MIRVDYDKNITVSKGDIATLKVKFSDNINGYKCYFTVKKNIGDQSTVIYKDNLTVIDNSLDINLSNLDTKQTKGVYYYDIKVVDRYNNPTKIITPFEPKKFIIIDTVKEI